MSLASRIALITGGASGLGRATVERFVKQGAQVVICDLPSSEGSALAESIGQRAVFVPTDVRKQHFAEFTTDKCRLPVKKI